MDTSSTDYLQRGKTLGFNEAEVAKFLAAAEKRKSEGKTWDELFPQGSDRLTLPLLMDGEGTTLGLDARIEAVLARYNAEVAQKRAALTSEAFEALPYQQKEQYFTFARDPENPKMLKAFLGNQKLNRDKKLTAFLDAQDVAEAQLLSQDLQVEWGLDKTQKITASTNKVTDFSTLKNNNPIAADDYDPARLRVVISRDPLDIAGMSTGKRWESCTGKVWQSREGFNYHTLEGELAAGSLVAYLVHEEDTAAQYPLARVMLKPFHKTSA